MPRRNPPIPSSGEPKNSSHPSCSSTGGGSGGQLGAFWFTQHAKDSLVPEEKSKPIFDEEPSSHHISLKHNKILPDNNELPKIGSTNKVVNIQTQTVKSSIQETSHKPDTRSSNELEIKFFQDKDHASERQMSSMENKATFQDQAFNAFVAEFDATKLNSGLVNKSEREEALVAEVQKLKEQLKEANLEKAEITSKYEKLSAICRSQMQELQNVKQALAAKTPPPNREGLGTSPGVLSSATANKTEWKAPSSEPMPWQAFPEEPQPQKSLSADNTSKSIRTGNVQQKKQPAQLATDFETWHFGTNDFSAARAGSPQMPRPSEGINSRVFTEAKAFESKSTSQPTGWAVF